MNILLFDIFFVLIILDILFIDILFDLINGKDFDLDDFDFGLICFFKIFLYNLNLFFFVFLLIEIMLLRWLEIFVDFIMKSMMNIIKSIRSVKYIFMWFIFEK